MKPTKRNTSHPHPPLLPEEEGHLIAALGRRDCPKKLKGLCGLALNGENLNGEDVRWLLDELKAGRPRVAHLMPAMLVLLKFTSEIERDDRMAEVVGRCCIWSANKSALLHQLARSIIVLPTVAPIVLLVLAFIGGQEAEAVLLLLIVPLGIFGVLEIALGLINWSNGVEHQREIQLTAMTTARTVVPPENLSPYVFALDHQDLWVHDAAEKHLRELLDADTPFEASSLHQLAVRMHRIGASDLHAASVAVMENLADPEHALQLLKSAHNHEFRPILARNIQQAIYRVGTRIQALQSTSTLLRPASAPADTLLHPAGAQETDNALLVRPSEVER